MMRIGNEYIGIEGLLARLDGVKKTGIDRWMARSPAREDRTPSLSIRLMDDGRILVHDFGGAEFSEILRAIDLKPIQLIPENLRRNNNHRAEPHRAPPVNCCDALLALALHATVIQVAAEMIARGEALDEKGLNQLSRAVDIITAAQQICLGGAK